MSIDRSLRVKGALARHRNVLSRAERLEILKNEERWSEQDSLLGLAKVAHRKARAGAAEEKTEKPEAAAAAEAPAKKE